LKNIALSSKDSKVRDVWLITGKELIMSLLEKLVKIKTVCGMTSRVNRLGLKQAISKRVLFFFLATPFYCGV
jgi:hypothetical protein